MSRWMCRATCFLPPGRSGTGKSVTLKHIIGLLKPIVPRIRARYRSHRLKRRELSEVRRSMDSCFRMPRSSTRLRSVKRRLSMRRHTDWDERKIRETAKSKLAEVGLADDFDKMPSDLSGA